MILGITFKENCPDVRNSKVTHLVDTLKNTGAQLDIYDSHADIIATKNEYGLILINLITIQYDAIILAIAHNVFKNLDWSTIRKKNTVIYDIKGFLNPLLVTKRP